MATKKRRKKALRVKLTLSVRDAEHLRGVARQMGVGRSVAARRLMREALKLHPLELADIQSENQLSIFDSMQYDIMGKTAKTAGHKGE
ncbi:MAG: hypothetical protein SPJ13_06915 [Bacteroidales bacterium]|nr:hypothetical protein [Bacteroidales bacterium]